MKAKKKHKQKWMPMKSSEDQTIQILGLVIDFLRLLTLIVGMLFLFFA